MPSHILVSTYLHPSYLIRFPPLRVTKRFDIHGLQIMYNTTIINSKPLETSVHYILTKMWHGNWFLYEFGGVMIVG